MIRELRIIVAGSRGFYDYQLLSNTLMDYLAEMDDKDVVDNPSQVKFISGTCRGADVLGEHFAYTYEYEVIRFPADWNTYGKRAGYIRNKEMAENADACICFWDNVSNGTRHMINIAKEKRLPLRIVKYKRFI